MAALKQRVAKLKTAVDDCGGRVTSNVEELAREVIPSVKMAVACATGDYESALSRARACAADGSQAPGIQSTRDGLSSLRKQLVELEAIEFEVDQIQLSLPDNIWSPEP